MRRTLSLITVSLAAAIAWVIILPARAVDWALARLPILFDPRPLRDLVEGPDLLLHSPAGPEISPALYQRNRHEAGLARLGAVRHT